MSLELYSPFGDLIGERTDPIYTDPRKLLNPRRLDIAVKMAFCRKLDGQPRHLANVDIDSLYAAHIEARTGGIEPNSIYRKRSTDDYKHFLERVFQEIKQHGFDPSEPIQMSAKTGMILNGAHRLAASVVLGLQEVPVIFDSNNSGREWGMPWFIDNGFSANEQMEIALTLMAYTPDSYNLGIIWPSDTVSPESVLDSLASSSTLFYLNALTPEAGLSEFLYDTYAYDYGVEVHQNADNIRRKAERMAEKSNQTAYLVAFSSESIESAVETRDSIRAQFKEDCDGPAFDVFHCASNEGERSHLRDLFFSPATLASYDYRDHLSDNLTSQLSHFARTIQNPQNTEFSRQDLCIVGGAVLDLYRFKHCDDIDFVLPYRIRRRHFDDKAHEIAEGVDLASYNYARKLNVGFTWSDDELARFGDLHCMARGFRFASLDIVFERKRWSPRAKDKVDISRIARHRQKSAYPLPPAPDPTFNEAELPLDQLLVECQKQHIQGQLHLAARLYRCVTERFPENPVGWEGLAVCALQRGDNAVARELLDKSASLGGTESTRRYQGYLNR